MKRLALLLVLLGAAGCDSSESTPSIDGEWSTVSTVTVDPGDGRAPYQETQTTTYTFAVDGEDVTGTLTIKNESPGAVETVGPIPFTGAYEFPDLTIRFAATGGAPAQTTEAEVNEVGTTITVFTSAPGGAVRVPLYTLRRS